MVLLLATAAPSSALAWGDHGHQIVAEVAERHLTATTLAAINGLLPSGDGGVVVDSVWADCIKRAANCGIDDGPFDGKVHPETEPWHFTDIPLSAPAYDPLRDCKHNHCSVAEIQAQLAVLTSSASAPADRLLALKFLLHLVGDLHQPLHNGSMPLPSGSSDKGGNLRFVKPPTGDKVDLHSYWDTSLVEDELGSKTPDLAAYAALIDAGPPPDPGAIDPVAWANQAHQVAPVVYSYPGAQGPQGLTVATPVLLLASYVTSSRAVVRQQLRLGGVRLAALLNQAFDPGGAGGLSQILPSPTATSQGLEAPRQASTGPGTQESDGTGPSGGGATR